MSHHLALAPATSDALARWLETEAATRDLSTHTVTAYRADLIAFLHFLGAHWGQPVAPKALSGLTQSDMRAFAAAERGRLPDEMLAEIRRRFEQVTAGSTE